MSGWAQESSAGKRSRRTAWASGRGDVGGVRTSNMACDVGTSKGERRGMQHWHRRATRLAASTRASDAACCVGASTREEGWRGINIINIGFQLRNNQSERITGWSLMD